MDRIAALRAFLAEDPTDSFTRFALAMEYRKKGDLREAVEMLAALTTDAPDYVGAYYHLGKLHEALGERDAAMAAYRAGVVRARDARAQKDLSELQDALLALEMGDDA